LGSRFELSRLLDPIETDAFFTDYWEKAPLLIARNKPSYFNDLLSLDDLDHALTTLNLHHPEIGLSNASADVTLKDYAFPNGRINVDAAFRMFDQGSSIIFNGLHARQETLGELSRALESTLSHPIQTNIYLTPPSAGAFKAHYDTHDVIVLQLENEKHWKIYGSPIALPLPGQHFNASAMEIGEPQLEIDLKAGDTLYLPRGYIHEARSVNAISAHITIGILSRTWVDFLIESIAEASIREVSLRRSLPIGFANVGFAAEQMKSDFKGLIAKLTGSLEFDASFNSLADEFIDSRSPQMRGHLTELIHLPSITIDSAVCLRPNLIYKTAQVDGAILIFAHGKECEIPSKAAEAVRVALSGRTFRIRDLPGALDDDEKLVIIRRLLREGVLQSA
jgi:hypothetical protein